MQGQGAGPGLLPGFQEPAHLAAPTEAWLRRWRLCAARQPRSVWGPLPRGGGLWLELPRQRLLAEMPVELEWEPGLWGVQFSAGLSPPLSHCSQSTVQLGGKQRRGCEARGGGGAGRPPGGGRLEAASRERLWAQRHPGPWAPLLPGSMCFPPLWVLGKGRPKPKGLNKT